MACGQPLESHCRVPRWARSIRSAVWEKSVGGTVIGQPTLIRFYVLHCALLPLVLFGIAAWHMWRIRKDGGMAIVDGLRLEARTRELVATRLRVPTLSLRDACHRWATRWLTRGAAVQAVLQSLPLDGSLLDRILAAGV